MKICVFYFSGTGNTKKVVDKFVEEFSKNGCDVRLENIENFYDKNIDFDLNGFDKIGVAYPVHAFNAPHNVLEFAKRLPKLEARKNLFVVNTSGEPLRLNNISSLKLHSILKRKNLFLQSENHYCMPYNIIFRHSDGTAYKMWQGAQILIPLDAKDIVDGKETRLKRVPLGRFIAWIFRIEHWGGRFNGKKYKVSDACVHCQTCVRRCPTKNITCENGEFKFGKNCVMCMRCSFFCPKDAIKIGLFNKWKVNGAYNFCPSQDEEAHKKYCKKAYIKYFQNIEQRAAAAKKQ